MWNPKFEDDTFTKYHPVTFAVGWGFIGGGVYVYLAFGPHWFIGALAVFLVIWGALIVRNQLTLKRQRDRSNSPSRPGNEN